jgi:hypothetical protein
MTYGKSELGPLHFLFVILAFDNPTATYPHLSGKSKRSSPGLTIDQVN